MIFDACSESREYFGKRLGSHAYAGAHLAVCNRQHAAGTLHCRPLLHVHKHEAAHGSFGVQGTRHAKICRQPRTLALKRVLVFFWFFFSIQRTRISRGAMQSGTIWETCPVFSRAYFSWVRIGQREERHVVFHSKNHVSLSEESDAGVVQRIANKGDVSGALFKWFTLAFLLEVKEPHDPDSLAAAAAGCNSAVSFFTFWCSDINTFHLYPIHM